MAKLEVNNPESVFRINIDILNEAFGVGRGMYAKAVYPDKKNSDIPGTKPGTDISFGCQSYMEILRNGKMLLVKMVQKYMKWPKAVGPKIGLMKILILTCCAWFLLRIRLKALIDLQEYLKVERWSFANIHIAELHQK